MKFRCIGKDCSMIVEESDRRNHLINCHPSFCYLVTSFKRSDLKDIDKYFEEVKEIDARTI